MGIHLLMATLQISVPFHVEYFGIILTFTDGFRKKTSIDQGALRSVREDVEFVHPHFKKGAPAQLELIKRKV